MNSLTTHYRRSQLIALPVSDLNLFLHFVLPLLPNQRL